VAGGAARLAAALSATIVLFGDMGATAAPVESVAVVAAGGLALRVQKYQAAASTTISSSTHVHQPRPSLR
jgi:hypothetical protein